MRIHNIKALREYTGLDFKWSSFTGVNGVTTPSYIWGIQYRFIILK